MNNKDLLKEGFFSDNFGGKKKKSSFPEYTPVDRNNPYGQGIGAVDTRNVKELKKRLEGGLGAVIGNNTVKNMANRAIKTFPIVISENVDPNTAVMLKNYLEQQYAEYINLLVSNQVIDITDYSRDNSEGNIAIQALDKITGTDFSKQRIANKAMNNSLSANDLFGNNPAYRLLRQENFKCGDPALDSLLEDAMIVDSKNVDSIIPLMETLSIPPEPNPNNNGTFRVPDINKTFTNLKAFNGAYRGDLKNLKKDDFNPGQSDNPYYVHSTITGFDKNGKTLGYTPGYSNYTRAHVQIQRSADFDKINKLKNNGFIDLDDEGYGRYDEFTNGEIAVDPRLLSNAINMQIGDVLNKPENKAIKDRYVDAAYLLYSRFISGAEFLDYVTKRLGIPVRNEVSRQLINDYTAKDLRSFDDYAGYSTISAEDAANNEKNVLKIKKYTKSIMSAKVADVLKYSGIGLAVGATTATGAGISIGLGSVSIAACAALAPFIAPIVIGTTVAGGLIGAIIAKLKKKKKTYTAKFDEKTSKYKPWEKVEAMIDKLNAQRLEVNKKYLTQDPDPDPSTKSTISVEDFTKDLNKFLESTNFIGFEDKLGVAYKPLNEEDLMINVDIYDALCECANENKEMNEAYDRISLIKPSEIIKARREMGVNVVNYDPDNTMMFPSYGARSQQAYGSVEYDRRELKDRRFNTPLILTVKFKERYSDGKYSDNELTAVIGILGVITRIPSEEMEYILKANAEGSTIKGFLSGDDKGSIGDIIAAFKKNRIDSSKLPQSAEVWKNLEKISQLAVANKLAGKSSNSVANAHIIFSQKEADSVRQELGIDYLRDRKLSASLMKRYSAMNLMIANDALERVFVFNDMDSLSWDVIPYDALRNKDSSELATLKNLLR